MHRCRALTLGTAQFAAIQAVAPTVGVEVTPIGVRDAGEIEPRPGRNATGFATYDYSISVKWLELLKEIAPSMKRVGLLRDPALALGAAQFAAIQAVAPTVG